MKMASLFRACNMNTNNKKTPMEKKTIMIERRSTAQKSLTRKREKSRNGGCHGSNKLPNKERMVVI
jgi:hypothetical protein